MKRSFKNFLVLLGTFGIGLTTFACGSSGDTSKETSSSTSASEQISSSEEVSSTQTSSSSEVDPGHTDYYNEENFIEGTREVNQTKLVTYDGPSILTTSKKAQVKVEGQELFVYETRVNDRRKFTWDVPSTTAPYVLFDFEGQVHVEITILENTKVESAVIRPLVYGIKPAIEGQTISFNLDYTGNYVVEYNDDPSTAIHLFANPIETEKMTKEEAEADENKIYVGPGVYKAGAFPIKSNMEIYLAGGAYVYGQFSGEDFENVKIYGRGIVSGEIYHRRTESEYTLPVVFRNCKNIHIQDICIVDPAGWAITYYKCKDSTVKNIKIITARQNGDGVSIQSCQNVEVSGGFVRTWDDSLVVKNSDRGTTNGVNIHDVVVWTDLAQSMEVGYETNGITMTNITFNNITVVHNFHKAVISMHNCDDALITNVKYTNITLEDGQMLGDVRDDGENDFLIDFTIAYNPDWTKSEGNRGIINGVEIRNVNVYKMADTITARFLGESDTSKISNVSIDSLKIADRPIASLADIGGVTNQYTENITVTPELEVLGAYITLPYFLNINREIDKTNMDNIEQEGMLVPEFAYQQGGLPYIGVKGNIATTNAVTHGVGSKTTTPVDDGSGDFTREGFSSNALTDGRDNTLWASKDWKGEDNEFVGITMEFDQHSTIGKLRIKGDPENQYYFTFTIEIWVRRQKTDGSMNDKYTRTSGAKEYEMSPTTGNAIDINLTSQLYGGIQLRLFASKSASAPGYYKLSEVEFYPPALTYGKAVVDASEHNDVYNVEKAVDGDPTGTSYYESKSLPAHIVIDLGAVYQITTIVLCLPPSLNWAARTQNIEMFVSDSNIAYEPTVQFTSIVPATDYLFDPTQGNRVTVTLDNPVNCRYFKLVINSNDVKAGYGAQLSEISVYGI